MIDPKKKYRTKTGREVHIYEVFDGKAYGRARHLDGSGWFCESWNADTDYLIEVKPERWVNLYRKSAPGPDDPEIIGYVYETKEKADYMAGCSRIACVKVEDYGV